MDRLFEVQDKSGRKIYLSKERWQHIAGEHPEIAPFLEEIKATLSQPTKFVEYESDKVIGYYYKYFKTGNAPTNYLLVIVKYLNGGGFIITAYFVKHIKNERSDASTL